MSLMLKRKGKVVEATAIAYVDIVREDNCDYGNLGGLGMPTKRRVRPN